MEIFDLYDCTGKKIGKTMNRGDKNNPGEYHLVVHIWFKNSSNEFLIQQRNKLDDKIPYQWAATGGAAIKGDTSIEAAHRETLEEIGLDLPFNKFELLKRYYIKVGGKNTTNYITDLYIVKEDILLKDLKLDTLEVRDATYKSMKEINEMIQQNLFWDYERNLERKGYFSLLEKS